MDSLFRGNDKAAGNEIAALSSKARNDRQCFPLTLTLSLQGRGNIKKYFYNYITVIWLLYGNNWENNLENMKKVWLLFNYLRKIMILCRNNLLFIYCINYQKSCFFGRKVVHKMRVARYKLQVLRKEKKKMDSRVASLLAIRDRQAERLFYVDICNDILRIKKK